MNNDQFISIRPQSESSVVVYFPDCISETNLEAITRIKHAVRQQPFIGFLEAVPGYASLTVYFDPLKVLSDNSLPGEYAFEKVIHFIEHLTVANAGDNDDQRKLISIPVCYDEQLGPDLQEVSAVTGLSIPDIIRLHSDTVYTVFMIGFMPGFPYLGGMNKQLASPRRSSPRPFVAAGSVGIAGEQTGIYPLDSPGGWQIIGRTPLQLFDIDSKTPALLNAGDRVRFVPLALSEFTELSEL